MSLSQSEIQLMLLLIMQSNGFVLKELKMSLTLCRLEQVLLPRMTVGLDHSEPLSSFWCEEERRAARLMFVNYNRLVMSIKVPQSRLNVKTVINVSSQY